MKWWERWGGGRFDAEVESFRKRDLDFALDPDAFAAGRVVLCGTIEVGVEVVDLEVHYPDRYPWTRFAVVAPNLTLPRHQHPSAKTLCVFPRSSRHWQRRLLAGDVVAERVPELIRLVRAGGSQLYEAEDPQGEPYSTYFPYWPLGGILIPEEIAEAAVGVDGGQIVIRTLGDAGWLDVDGHVPTAADSRSVGAAVAMELRRGSTTLATVDRERWVHTGGATFTAEWLRIDPPPVFAEGPAVVRYLMENYPLARESLADAGSRAHLFGVVFEEEIRHREFGDAWMFPFTRAEALPVGLKRTPKPRPLAAQVLRGMQVGADLLGERIPELAPLRERVVSVVGLGTLGAPFAKEMARSLVRELRILDFDFVDPATAVRWELGASVAGAQKTFAVRAHLAGNYPQTTVVPVEGMLGATGEDDAVLASLFTGADLIVDATAEDNVSAALADYAWERDIPFLAYWSIEGVGGLIARLIRGQTGCYHCLELAISADGGTIALPAEPATPRRVQPRGCADPTFTAPAADLTPLVPQAARIAFGELCAGAEGGYPRSAFDVHVLWLREPDGSLVEPIRWDAHPLPIDERCTLHPDGS